MFSMARECALPPGITLPAKGLANSAGCDRMACHASGNRRCPPFSARISGKSVQGVLVVTPAEYLKRRGKSGNQ